MPSKKDSKPENAVHTSSGSAGGDVIASSVNPWIYWVVIAVVLVLDVVTKTIAEYTLLPMYTPHEIIGDYLRFTLVYNPGAAFGIHVGEFSRWFFLTLTVVALVILFRMYRATPERAIPRVLALGLVSAGAMGNLIDRIRSDKGVVDFIDVGIGVHRWPTFNIADMAVSTGAILLAWVLLQEDRAAARSVVPAGDS